MDPSARKAIGKLKPGEALLEALLLDNIGSVSEELLETLPEKQAETYELSFHFRRES